MVPLETFPLPRPLDRFGTAFPAALGEVEVQPSRVGKTLTPSRVVRVISPVPSQLGQRSVKLIRPLQEAHV